MVEAPVDRQSTHNAGGTLARHVSLCTNLAIPAESFDRIGDQLTRVSRLQELRLVCTYIHDVFIADIEDLSLEIALNS